MSHALFLVSVPLKVRKWLIRVYNNCQSEGGVDEADEALSAEAVRDCSVLEKTNASVCRDFHTAHLISAFAVRDQNIKRV